MRGPKRDKMKINKFCSVIIFDDILVFPLEENGFNFSKFATDADEISCVIAKNGNPLLTIIRVSDRNASVGKSEPTSM